MLRILCAKCDVARGRRTEHGLESYGAEDEVVKVNLTLLVTVAHHEAFERRIAHQKTCTHQPP